LQSEFDKEKKGVEVVSSSNATLICVWTQQKLLWFDCNKAA
jgi:hypothetical protein